MLVSVAVLRVPANSIASYSINNDKDVGMQTKSSLSASRLEIAMGGHLMMFAAFFIEAHPPAFGFRKVVFNFHGDHGADARKV